MHCSSVGGCSALWTGPTSPPMQAHYLSSCAWVMNEWMDCDKGETAPSQPRLWTIHRGTNTSPVLGTCILSSSGEVELQLSKCNCRSNDTRPENHLYSSVAVLGVWRCTSFVFRINAALSQYNSTWPDEVYVVNAVQLTGHRTPGHSPRSLDGMFFPWPVCRTGLKPERLLMYLPFQALVCDSLTTLSVQCATAPKKWTKQGPQWNSHSPLLMCYPSQTGWNPPPPKHTRASANDWAWNVSATCVNIDSTFN